jgi:hypothetical protein
MPALMTGVAFGRVNRTIGVVVAILCTPGAVGPRVTVACDPGDVRFAERSTNISMDLVKGFRAWASYM